MKNKLLFVIAGVGLVLGCIAAYLFAIKRPAQPPAFEPASNPFKSGIYAEGIVESDQSSGSNISLYPEVPGTVKRILVHEGQSVHAGDRLLMIDDSIQSAATEQQQAQAEAAHTQLEELRAQPRPENLRIADAEVAAAGATLKTAEDALRKQDDAYRTDPRSVSRDALDAARNASAVAKANLALAERQYDLTRAGAWSYDVRNQERQYQALLHAHLSSAALLAKYVIHAPSDATVLSVNTSVGSYISPQGAYDVYTQSAQPVLVLSAPQATMHVRCYVDEILVSHMKIGSALEAQMTVRGTTVKVPLHFDRIQPFVSPKIELSNQRQERVDVRVLPVIFSFDRPKDINLFPGELVDVYIAN